jgi:GTP-binding protein
MKIIKAQFVMSAARFSDLPPSAGTEYCVMGRSNVGKSSFINHVFSDRGLARVSNKPGKTTLANFFKVSDGTVWVDLPGYGYAQTAKIQRARWSALIEDYCVKRENLRGVVWLLDIRHPGLAIDLEAGEWLMRAGLPALPVLTKCDKLPKSAVAAQKRLFVKALGPAFDPLVYSVNQPEYRDLFWRRFAQWTTEGLQP